MAGDHVSLSIIIPIYNVEKYLGECIGSLLKTKGIEDTEIILVDDGATDDSGSIADRYAEGYGFIRCYHKENGGLSDARNYGLDKATGKYVFFCDADDKVVPEPFETIIEKTSTYDEDIIAWDADLIDEEGNPTDVIDRAYFAHNGLEKKEQVITGKKLIEAQLKASDNYVVTVWLGAYKRDLLIRNGLFFEKGLLHEDELWSPHVLLTADTVRYIPGKAYLYRIRTGSITNDSDNDRSKHIDSLIHIYNSLYDFYDEVLDGDPLKELIEENLTKRYLYYIFKDRFYKNGNSNKIDRKRLWKTSRRIKDKIKIIILTVIGR